MSKIPFNLLGSWKTSPVVSARRHTAVEDASTLPPSSVRKLEIVTAVLLSAVITSFHVVRVVTAGALWRDEAAAVQLATMPSFHDVLAYFPHEAFPLLFPVVVRVFANMIGGGDLAWRLFGLGVGICTLGAVWLATWKVRGRVPLLSLALIGFNGAILVWCDTIRGYGLGTLAILLTTVLIWHILQRPNGWRVAGATVGAVASVQLLFQNSALVFALCVGALTVAWRRKDRRGIEMILLVGTVAAASLLPYWSPLLKARSWDEVIHQEAGPGYYFGRLAVAMSGCGWWNALVWVFLLISGLMFSIWAQFKPAEPREKDLLLFSGVAVSLGVLGYVGFLALVSHPVQTWHCVALLGFAGLLLDLLWAGQSRWPGAPVVRASMALLLAAVSVLPCWEQSKIRLTNIDVVAAKLERLAVPGDLVVITPEYYGISFARYYHGAAAWMTIPPTDFHSFHRYDLLKAAMVATDQSQPIEPVLARAQEVLSQGHRVWVAGAQRLTEPGEVLPVLAPAPAAGTGWQDQPYFDVWSGTALAYLEARSASYQPVPLSVDASVSPFEDLPLFVFEPGQASAPAR